MNRDFIGALLQLNAEKGVPQEILIRTLEQAIESAYRRNADAPENVVVTVNPETGEISVAREYEVMATPEEVEDPEAQMIVADAQKIDPTTGVGGKVRDPGERDPGPARPDRGADGGAGLPAAPARGAARRRLPAVRGPRGRDHDRHRAAHDRFGRGARHGQGRRGGAGGHRAAAEPRRTASGST